MTEKQYCAIIGHIVVEDTQYSASVRINYEGKDEQTYWSDSGIDDSTDCYTITENKTHRAVAEFEAQGWSIERYEYSGEADIPTGEARYAYTMSK